MKKILIVDDQLDIIDVLERFLLKSGKVEVTTNSNPKAALIDIKNNNYDLVLTDIMMPTLSGVEILESIKKISPTIKVIMMTAYDTPLKKDKSVKLNCDGYITKPFTDLKSVENVIFSALSI